MARPDHEVPPARAAVLMFTGDVGIAAQRVEDQDRVRFLVVERAPRLIGDLMRRQRAPAVERERLINFVRRVRWVVKTAQDTNPMCF